MDETGALTVTQMDRRLVALKTPASLAAGEIELSRKAAVWQPILTANPDCARAFSLMPHAFPVSGQLHK